MNNIILFSQRFVSRATVVVIDKNTPVIQSAVDSVYR